MSQQAATLLHVVPVRRDATGRLVAVGLLRVAVPAGGGHWRTLQGNVRQGETSLESAERCVRETLGPEVRLHRVVTSILAGSPAQATPGDADRAKTRLYAVELRGRPQATRAGPDFVWFLVSALPRRADVSVGEWRTLAALLDALGERGAAARLRLFEGPGP